MNVSAKSRLLTVLLSVLAGVLLIVCVLMSLALSVPDAEKMNREVPLSGDLAEKLLPCALSGQECAFTEDEVNGYLAYRDVFHSSVTVMNGAVLNRVIVSFHPDNTADLILPVQYAGKNLEVAVGFEPVCQSGALVMRVRSVRVGKLSLPTGWVLGQLKGKLPEGVTLDGTDIRIKSMLLQYQKLGVTAGVELTDLRLEGSVLKIKAKATVNAPLAGFFS